MRKVNLIILHCSASQIANQNAAMIREWHTAPPPEGRGWDDIGYHAFIGFSGLLEAGRAWDTIGSHCEGYNEHSIGVCLAGLLEDSFNDAQFNSLKLLLSLLKKIYPFATLHAHWEFNHQKTCPVFDIEPWKRVWDSFR